MPRSRLFLLIAVLSSLFVLAGCNPDSRGFKLPDGDIAAGKAAFVTLACNECHHVGDIAHDPQANSGFDLRLGGRTTKVKTYGELVTSIINPSHKIARRYSEQPLSVDGESVMRKYNDLMTVQQLVDLVTFLETQYDLQLPHSYMHM